jgi:hypothetical protein
MPEVLKKWLESLEDTDAEMVWEFLDEDPDALDSMIAIVAKKLA